MKKTKTITGPSIEKLVAFHEAAACLPEQLMRADLMTFFSGVMNGYTLSTEEQVDLLEEMKKALLNALRLQSFCNEKETNDEEETGDEKLH